MVFVKTLVWIHRWKQVLNFITIQQAKYNMLTGCTRISDHLHMLGMLYLELLDSLYLSVVFLETLLFYCSSSGEWKLSSSMIYLFDFIYLFHLFMYHVLFIFIFFVASSVPSLFEKGLLSQRMDLVILWV